MIFCEKIIIRVRISEHGLSSSILKQNKSKIQKKYWGGKVTGVLEAKKKLFACKGSA